MNKENREEQQRAMIASVLGIELERESEREGAQDELTRMRLAVTLHQDNVNQIV